VKHRIPDDQQANGTNHRDPSRAHDINLDVKEENYMQKIIPFLWFDTQAEEAMNFVSQHLTKIEIEGLKRAYEQG